jgi:zinc protease
MRPVAVLALILAAAPAALGAERVVLDNGLTVLLAPRPSGDAVAARAFVLGGRAGEPEALAGVSHLAEHLVFRATARRAAGAAEREVWRLGGRASAYTAEDFTEYGVLLPREDLDLALDVLADALRGAAFRPEEVEEERRVVLDEIARGEAEPESVAFMELRRLAFAPHPYGERIYGTAESVSRIGRDDLATFFRSRVRPERTVLVLAGNFDPADALACVRKWFGDWTSPGPPPPPVPAPRDRFGPSQEAVLYRAGATPTLYLSASLPGYLHPDYLPLRFLREILVGWLGERLVTKTSLALAAETFFSAMADRNLLTVRLTLPDAAGAAKARDTLLGLLEDLARPDFPITGLPEVASFFEARERLAVEDPEMLARHIGRGAMYGFHTADGIPAGLSGPDRYRRVTGDDIHRVAGRWLATPNLRVLWLLPPGSELPPPASVTPGEGAFGPLPPVSRVPVREPEVSVDDAAQAGDEGFSRVEVSPRLTLLCAERPGRDLASGALVFSAGSKYDPPGREGLATLALRAAAASSAAEGADLRWRMYAFGNSWSLGVERDLSVISFTVPAEELEPALRTVAAMLRSDSFPEAAIVEARGSVLSDLRSAAQRPAAHAVAAFRALAFRGGPYAHDPLGTESGVTAASREEVAEFFRRHYLEGPAMLALVGPVSPRKAREMAGLLLGPEEDPVPPEVPVRATTPGPSDLVLTHPAGRTFLVSGVRAPKAGDPREAEAAVLQMALGWQVFRHFTKERSTAYEAGAFEEALATDGLLAVYAGIGPDREEEAAGAMDAFLAAARETGLPEDLARDARRAWLGATAISETRSVVAAIRLARREALSAPFSELRRRVVELSPGSLAEAARELLTPGRILRVRLRR